MPYLKEGQLRQRVTPVVGSADPEPEIQYSSAATALAWVKTNWMYLVGAIGVLVVIALMVYFYKKGMLFGSSTGGSGIQYY